MAKKNNITIAGPADANRLGVTPSTSPSGSPKVNGETTGPMNQYKRTSSSNAADEVTLDGSVGRLAKDNVGGRS